MIPNRNYTNSSPSYPPSYMYGQPQQSNQHNNLHSNPNQQQQQQQQQQLQQQQQQQQQQQAQSTNGDGGSNGAASAVPEMNLAGVLHYLQSEWRRWERDRNEWEIERAEMRARIALLEGQRRSAENLKVDLLRRVKMLEFALRQARSSSQSVKGIAPAKYAALQDEDKPKEDSGSEGSEEGEKEKPKANGIHPAAMKSIGFKDTTSWKGTGGVSRDPKSRARSQEYLKQCLQEITYLTSPGALNPLPSRAPITNEPSSPQSEPNGLPDVASRPKKSMPDRALPSAMDQPKPEPVAEVVSEPTTSEPTVQPPSEPMSIEPTARPPSSPSPRKLVLEEETDPKQVLTAIYRPDSKAAWRKELEAAGEQAHIKAPSDQEQLASLTLPDEEKVERVWTCRKTLKSHLDVVRCVAFGGEKVVLASGGDDFTVKVWSVEPEAVMTTKPAGTSEIEPIMTYRGHSAAITSVVISTPLKQIISGSIDSTIRCWKLPETNQDPYASYDPSTSIETLVGHTDAVWDLVLIKTDKTKLVSASADGSIKVWSRSKKWAVDATYKVSGRPTCLADYGNQDHVLVGTSEGRVVVYSLRTNSVVNTIDLKSENSQVNAVLRHPTSPKIIVAHEDGYIRLANPESSEPVQEYLAHPAAITSLSLCPLSPLTILTSSIDCSIRMWDIGSMTFVHGLSGHRDRAGEGVGMIRCHPELPILGSAGSDGVVRLWAAG